MPTAAPFNRTQLTSDMMDDYGHRLLPSVLHHEAQNHPEQTFAIVPRSEKTEDGFQVLTFRQVARAVDFLASVLLVKFPQTVRHETIAYMGVPDVRYSIMFYAAVQCRWKVFLPSPRNPVAVNSSLLDETQCSKLVYGSGVGAVAEALQTARPQLQMLQIPSLEEMLAGSSTTAKYNFRYRDVYREPILILHSSGSTGLPNPITMTHGTLATYDIRDWPTVDGRTNHDGLQTLRFPEPGSRAYDVFPPFHIAGFMVKVMMPVYNLTAPVYGPALRPPSGALVAELLRLHRPRVACLPPTVTEQLYRDPDGLSLLKGLDVLLYAGGPLADSVGAELSKHTTLCQFYGSTDMGQIRQLLPLRHDWAYIEFHPSERFEMQPHGDGMFELVVFVDKDLEDTSSLYHNFPDVREWRTKDLFSPHPENSNLWKFATRTDDILVFSSGEKLNPIPMESALSAVPGIRGALVVGQRQSQSALLLELDPEHSFSAEPQEELWPAIEQANKLLPLHGRISPAMVILSSPNKAFVRAGKGTVVRRLTEEAYKEEISDVFARDHTNGRPAQPTKLPIGPSLKPTAFRIIDLKTFLRAVLREVSLPGDMGDQDNIYAHGMDSIRTTEVVGHLKTHLAAYKSSQEMSWLSGELLYRNPTVEELALILLGFLNDDVRPQRRDRVQEMQVQIDACVSRLPQVTEHSGSRKRGDKLKVAITGTTGFFGRHLVATAISEPRVGKVYCLNRSATARETFERYHALPDTDRLEFMHVDLTAPDLGLDASRYKELEQNCDVIIHNAWTVDFNRGLASFADNLQSVEQLIRLSAASQHRARIIFVSSVSSTGVWAPVGSAQQTVPTAVVDDLASTMDIGYAESKHVAEHVLHAAAKAGVPTSILRMGLLAPPMAKAAEGWPENDTIRVFLQTCKSLGLVASDFVGSVDWVPVDAAAAAVLETVHRDMAQSGTMHVYNVVHPHSRAWPELLPPILAWCGGAAQTVRLREWTQALRAADRADVATLRRLPALRMMAIFELMARHGPEHAYTTTNLVNASPTMAALPPVDASQMQRWLALLDERTG